MSPVIEMPSMKVRCTRKNKMISGAVATVLAAIR